MKGVGGALQGHLGRLVLAGLAIVLGISAISGALLTRSALTATATEAVSALTSADVYIVPPGTTVADTIMKPDPTRGFLDPSILVQTQRLGDVVGAVMPVYLGPIDLMDKSGKVVPAGALPSVGLPSDDRGVEGGVLTEGALPTSLQEIALEAATAARAGLKTGDQTTVVMSGQTIPVTVTGIVSYNASLGGAVVVIVNSTVAKALYSQSGLIPFVAVKAKDGVSPQQLKEGVQAGLPKDAIADVVLGDDARRATVATISAGQGLINIGLIALGIIGLILAAYLVGTTYAVVRREQSRDIATAKALGATPGQITAPALRQAALVGLVGSVVGLAGGYILAAAVRSYAATHGVTLAGSLPWLWMVGAVALGVVVAVGAAWWAVRKAVAIKPLEALHPNLKSQFRMGAVRIALGVLLLLAGVAGIVWGLRNPVNVWYVGGGAAVAVLGILLVGPVIVVVLAAVFALPVRLFAPLTGKLAVRNIRRRPRRAANVAGIWVVFMGAATAIAVLAGSVAAATAAQRTVDTPADFVVTSTAYNGVIPDSVVAPLRQLTGARVTTFGLAPLTVMEKDAPVDATVMFGQPQTFTTVVKTPVVAGDPAAFSTGLAVSATFATAHGLKVGDTVNFTVAPGTAYQAPVSLPVGLIFDSSAYGDILVPSNWISQQVAGHVRSQFMPTTMVLVSATTAQIKDIQQGLTDAVAGYPSVRIQTGEEYVNAPGPLVWQSRVAMIVLGGVGAVLGLIALVNVLQYAVARRRGETAMVKALGVRSGQVGRGVVVESVLISFAGALTGVGVGIGLAYVATRAFPQLAPIVWKDLPWVWLAALLVAAIVVGLLAAIGPAWRTNRVRAAAPVLA